MSRGNGRPFLSHLDIKDNKMIPREVSWQEIENHSRELADRIIKKDLRYDVIVGVGRGGLVPAVILSHQMGVPLVPINWQTRDGNVAMENFSLLSNITKFNTNILIIDDINDTGTTLNELLRATKDVLKNANRSCIINTATIYQKPSTTFTSNAYVELVDDNIWCVFPWEAE